MSRLEKYLVNEDARTDFLETSAMIGVNASSKFIDICKKLVTYDKGRYNETVELINQFLSELHGQFVSAMDWNNKGVSAILKLKEDDVSELITIAHLALGMNNFVSSQVGISNKYFIHSKIKDYYKAEEKTLGKSKGSKDNTADCVICSAPADVVISALSTTKPEVDEVSGFYTLGNIKCYQVSLKKSVEGAQLGKVAGFIKTSLHLGKPVSDSADKLVKSINEGMWDTIKSSVSNIWDKFTSLIDNALSNMKSLFGSLFRRGVTKDDLNDIAKAIDYEGPITESIMDYYNRPMLNEWFGSKDKEQDKIQSFTEAIKQRADKVIALINNNISKAINVGSKKKDVVSFTTLMSSVGGKVSDKDAHDLVSNYSISQTILDFITKVPDVGDTVKKIIVQMFFGNTSLPLWKVYGAYGKEDCWQYLGTPDTFSIDNGDKPVDVEVFGYKVVPNKSKNCYDMMLVMLDKVNEEGKSYILFRADNNMGTKAFAANIEGTKEVTVSLNKSMIDVLKKYKI